LALIEGASAEGSVKPSDDYPDYNVRMVPARVSYGNSSLPFNLPEEKSTITQVSGKMARDVEQSAKKSDNAVVEGVSNLLRYVETLLGISDIVGADKDATNESEADETISPESAHEDEPTAVPSINMSTQPESKEKNLSGQENYELSIEGVKSSEH